MLNVTTVRQSGHAGWFRMLDLPEESQQHCLICAVCRTEGETHLRNFLRLSLGGNLFVPGKTLRSRTICEHISECDCHTVQKVAVPGLGSTAGWLTSYWEAPYILPPYSPECTDTTAWRESSCVLQQWDMFRRVTGFLSLEIAKYFLHNLLSPGPMSNWK